MSNAYRAVVSAGGGAAVGDATAADVLTGKTFSGAVGSGVSGTMPNNGAVSQTLSAGQSYTIPAGYHNGSGTVTAAIPNILNSKCIAVQTVPAGSPPGNTTVPFTAANNIANGSYEIYQFANSQVGDKLSDHISDATAYWIGTIYIDDTTNQYLSSYGSAQGGSNKITINGATMTVPVAVSSASRTFALYKI